MLKLFSKLTKVEKVVADLRAENARLKGLKGPPDIKPSGMDKGTGPAKRDQPRNRPGRGKIRPRVGVEDQILSAGVAPGSRFKGYVYYLVQDLVLSVRAIRYRRERWVRPNGQTIIAPLPEETDGHFGPELRRFILRLYYQGQTTLSGLVTLLHGFGLAISEREVQRCLTDGHDGFLEEARDVLRAGLQTSRWVATDDTGARHQAKNGYRTQVGNETFTWFGTVIEEPADLS